MFSNFKKIFNKINFGLALFFIASTASAQTTDVDNYKPLIGAGLYSDFKSNYSPDVLNATVANGVYTLRSRHGGLAQPRVKIFIPPGAKKLRTSILLYAADQPARAAARFASPPVSLITDIGSNANGNATTSKTLEILLNNPNQELLFYSPERSGLLMVATADSESSYQSTTGGYIYINFFMIPGSRFMSFDAQVEVDQACYTNWYQSINNSNAWNSAGNPQDGVRYTCAGGGTVTPPVLTGITLSRSTWNATTDANNTSITVTPQPAGAVLPACTSSNPNVLTAGAAGEFVINPAAVTSNTTVTVACGGKTATLTLQAANTPPTLTGISLSRSTWNATADANNTSITVTPQPAGAVLPACTSSNTNVLTAGTPGQFVVNPAAVTSNTSVTVTCGGKAASLVLEAATADAPQIQNLVTNIPDANGNLQIKFDFVRNATEVVGKTDTSFWVAARIPAQTLGNGFFFREDEWFFLTPNSWKELLLPNPGSVAFVTKVGAQRATTPFTIATDLPSDILKAFSVDIHFGYMDAGGTFKDMGVIWDKTK